MKTIYKTSFLNAFSRGVDYPWFVKAIVLIAVLVNLCLLVSATNYTLTTTGKWTSETIWSPGYPGDVIGSGDTVVLDRVVTANVPLTIYGTLVILEEAAVIGNKEIFISSGGTLINHGNMVAGSIVNDGSIYNYLIMETSEDVSNNGFVSNYETLVIGTDLLNTGTIQGYSGMVMSNNSIINEGSGVISGSIDLCASASIQNNGDVDSNKLSICGVPVFKDLVDWTVATGNETVSIEIQEPKNLNFQYLSVEKSFDGKTFREIKAVMKNDFSKYSKNFVYADEALSGETVYYRIKVIDTYGIVSYVPKIEFRYSSATASAER